MLGGDFSEYVCVCDWYLFDLSFLPSACSACSCWMNEKLRVFSALTLCSLPGILNLAHLTWILIQLCKQHISIFVRMICKKLFLSLPPVLLLPKVYNLGVFSTKPLPLFTYTHARSIEIPSRKACRHFPILTLLVITARGLVFVLWNLFSCSFLWDFSLHWPLPFICVPLTSGGKSPPGPPARDRLRD